MQFVLFAKTIILKPLIQLTHSNMHIKYQIHKIKNARKTKAINEQKKLKEVKFDKIYETIFDFEFCNTNNAYKNNN